MDTLTKILNLNKKKITNSYHLFDSHQYIFKIFIKIIIFKVSHMKFSLNNFSNSMLLLYCGITVYYNCLTNYYFILYKEIYTKDATKSKTITWGKISVILIY